MKASELIPSLSRWLSDQAPGDEFARWTETELFDAFRWATQFIAAIKPEAFTRPIAITLVPGDHQELPSCCNRVTDTLDNAIPTSRRSWRLIDHRRLCPPKHIDGRKYKVMEYAYSDQSSDSIWVFPPVPKEADGQEFQVICQYDPSPVDPDDDLPVRPSVKAIVFSLMVLYVATGENESPSLERSAQQHFQVAAQYLGITRDHLRLKLSEEHEEDAKVVR